MRHVIKKPLAQRKNCYTHIFSSLSKMLHNKNLSFNFALPQFDANALQNITNEKRRETSPIRIVKNRAAMIAGWWRRWLIKKFKTCLLFNFAIAFKWVHSYLSPMKFEGINTGGKKESKARRSAINEFGTNAFYSWKKSQNYNDSLHRRHSCFI